ncbi:transcriptional regulator, XRE family [Thermoanaerobacter mathranii subsp. mathranii str. A3]|uniref:Transcriptional regulator, XRE family n=1 Tax=Thermoanaerobacter mathranii subsp. mathranii (strain DSM 11426 / CCUG 53645 / CIP 108742 / A3) TaxID=583358 RepID=A0ABN3Z1T3_THEM3|nr:type II toxin-antitoxin system MqsA family antitoxin [Thermoanaerobacter mathranii]ADH59876.1 transcriptional regulator, XRE family [Thermoanaerobacter mathranii subsp. mathranii str. A3]
MKKFCPVCGKEQETKVIEKEEISTVRGDEIKALAKIRVCSVCGEELFDEELEEENIQRVYDIYRKKHGILSPDEIRNIRESYRLSQRAFAKLLGIGEASIARYETGALPEKSLSNMIMLLKDPENMEKLLEKNKEALTPREKMRLLRRLKEIKKDEEENAVKISKELYSLLEDKARREGKSTDKFIEEILRKVI